MKIGDRVFVRGYIDEIHKDTVIIRNAGGYFGTIPSEVITGELPSAQPEDAALHESCTDCPLYDHDKHRCPRFNKVIPTTIQEIQDTQPKMRGKWVYNSPVTMKCDQCGFVVKDWDWHRFNFCPNCRADMREE